MTQIISSVVESFYKKATTDILIGYQFRKIAMQESQSQGHPLRPPIEAFAHHLPRITHFWQSQLLGIKIPKEEAPFDLIGIHQKLSMRKGELHRWLTLFRETLNEFEAEDPKLIKLWHEKIDHFEGVFLTSAKLFKRH